MMYTFRTMKAIEMVEMALRKKATQKKKSEVKRFKNGYLAYLSWPVGSTSYKTEKKK